MSSWKVRSHVAVAVAPATVAQIAPENRNRYSPSSAVSQSRGVTSRPYSAHTTDAVCLTADVRVTAVAPILAVGFSSSSIEACSSVILVPRLSTVSRTATSLAGCELEPQAPAPASAVVTSDASAANHALRKPFHAGVVVSVRESAS